MNQFLLGAIAALMLVASMIFLRSWRQTNDRLFLLFSLSFLVEGLNRTVLALSANPREGEPVVYVVRSAAFLLIVYAIWDKNKIRTAP
jgi:uncharacterized membrane protein HdeD (DUF308 family)